MLNLSNWDPQAKEALGRVAAALGLAALKGLEPEQLLAKATEVVATEVRVAVREALSDENSPLVQLLVDKLYEELDQDEVVNSISKPLASALTDYFKGDGSSDLVEGIVNEMDLDSVGQAAGEKIADRLSRSG